MALAGAKPTPSETPIPLSKAAREILKSCSAKEAEQVMVRGLWSRRIRLSWRRLEGFGPDDPTPDQAEFWQKRDPRTGGDVQHSPRFPWADDLIVRKVHTRHNPRQHTRLLRHCTVYGASVLWSEVVAVFLADARLTLPGAAPEMATATAEAAANSKAQVEADQPGTPAAPKEDTRIWFAKALKAHPRRQDEQPGYYADRIYRLHLAANLTRYWKPRTFNRRIEEAAKSAQRLRSPPAKR